MQINLFRRFSKKWRTILLISYFSFVVIFITGVVLTKVYLSLISGILFNAGFVLCCAYLILKVVANRAGQVNIVKPSENIINTN